MYDLTQGHPALLQRICKELVDIANKDGRRDLTQADLDRVIDQKLLINRPTKSLFLRRNFANLMRSKPLFVPFSRMKP